MNIYISGLNFSTTDADLNDLFSEYGEVSSARIITDRETRRSRGFGFVEMPYKTTRFRFPAVAKRRVSTLLWDTSTRKVLSLRTDSGDIHSAPMSTTTSPTPSRLGCPLHSAKPLTTAFPMTTSATASLHAPSSSGRLMCRSKKMEDT